jgi:hypothetical protein
LSGILVHLSEVLVRLVRSACHGPFLCSATKSICLPGAARCTVPMSWSYAHYGCSGAGVRSADSSGGHFTEDRPPTSLRPQCTGRDVSWLDPRPRRHPAPPVQLNSSPPGAVNRTRRLVLLRRRPHKHIWRAISSGMRATECYAASCHIRALTRCRGTRHASCPRCYTVRCGLGRADVRQSPASDSDIGVV